LKERVARIWGDLVVLTSFQLSDFSFQFVQPANSASAECRVKDRYEMSVRQWWVILCKWVGGGEAVCDLKDLKDQVAADLGGFLVFWCSVG
jgi:hypothetical protein